MTLKLLATTDVRAANIEVFQLPETPVSIISIQGELVRGDAKRFTEAASELGRASIILNSPGGLVKEALEIGTTIRLSGFSTIVAAEQECFSACGLIWVSGTRRYMSKTSIIGFHAAYREEKGEYKESGVANAEIGAYLAHLGLRIEAIRYFTLAGPNDFLLLSPTRARELGIEIFEIDGSGMFRPAEKPTVDIYADRFVSYALLESRCRTIIQPDIVTLKAGQDSAFKGGNALVASETWVKLWLPLLDEAKFQLSEQGPLSLCLKTEAHLRSQGQQTGINGPSFSCAKPSTATELALCHEPSLWAKDRAMDSVYFWVRENVKKDIRKQWLAAQREWLAARNRCGSDTNCLNRVYDQRLLEFSGIQIPE